jgi:hypothetical protein
MKPSSYLYKSLSPNLANMTYKDALLHKLEQAGVLNRELVNVHYTIRDNQRLREIRDAISFNEALLKELKEY